MTAPIRTLIDFAARADEDELERASPRPSRFAWSAAARSCASSTAPPPARNPLAAAAARGERTAAHPLTPERELLKLIRAAGLPEPEANVRVGGWEVNLLWRAERVIVEVDGYAAHSSPWAFERDRRKTAALQALGYVVLRVTPRQIADHPGRVVGWVERELWARPLRRSH